MHQRGTLPKPPGQTQEGSFRFVPERIPAEASTAAAPGPRQPRPLLEQVRGSRPPPPPQPVLSMCPRERGWEVQTSLPDGRWQAKGAEALPCGAVLRERVPASRPPPPPTGLPPPQPARGNAPASFPHASSAVLDSPDRRHGYPRNSSVSSIGGRPPPEAAQHITSGPNLILPRSQPLPQPPPPSSKRSSSASAGSLDMPYPLRREPPSMSPHVAVSLDHQRSVPKLADLSPTEESKGSVDPVHPAFQGVGAMNHRLSYDSDYQGKPAIDVARGSQAFQEIGPMNDRLSYDSDYEGKHVIDAARGSHSSTRVDDGQLLRGGGHTPERSPSLASRSASLDEPLDGHDPSESPDEAPLAVRERHVRASRTHTRWGDVLMANTKQGKRASKCYSKWAVSV
mmetsp:Transcript_48665/g.89729  ORF Transcript_48665/g.89729 Transcript_48665/m.89729 type:complete len:397 (-) Transcript_48665:26-1216(-)